MEQFNCKIYSPVVLFEVMSQADETFFTSVGCMDGRMQEPVLGFGRKQFKAKYPDTITEAGLVGALSKQSINKNLFSSLKRKIFISLERHHSKGIVVHGHEDCAGNPVEDKKHKKDILKAAELIQSLTPKDTPVVPVFVKRRNGSWVVLQIKV